ncbi:MULTISPECIES: hypothetical protein [unclassified Burkholderia]|uniref:hypothetical protein n=1 Tax=unclassified Burkholderia TaxID=2613784 RepID=UPI000F5D8020|nr:MULTISPECIES: hypothetical protein [unclassified Burkholderia]
MNNGVSRSAQPRKMSPMKKAVLLIISIGALLYGADAVDPKWGATCSGFDYQGLHANPVDLANHAEVLERHVKKPVVNRCEFTPDNAARKIYEKFSS